MKDSSNFDCDIQLLKRWCSDCIYRGRTFLHDPCHDCSDEFSEDNGFTPNYYEQEQKRK